MSVAAQFISSTNVPQRQNDTALRIASDNGKQSFSDLLAVVKSSAATSPARTLSEDKTITASGARYREILLSSARSDPAEAEKLLAFNTAPGSGSFPLIDISNWPTVRYSVSGELQTPESEAYFANAALSADKARAELVQTERAKGTPAADILEKVLALNSALPSRYKDMANISY